MFDLINKHMKPDERQLPQIVLTSQFVVLSTIDPRGYPHTRAMLNLRNEKLYPHLQALYRADGNPMASYLTTNTSSDKTAEILSCPKACLYYFDGAHYEGICLRGKVEMVAAAEFKKQAWGPGWEEYYPDGVGSEDFAMLRFVPESIESYGSLSVEKVDLSRI